MQNDVSGKGIAEEEEGGSVVQAGDFCLSAMTARIIVWMKKGSAPSKYRQTLMFRRSGQMG